MPDAIGEQIAGLHRLADLFRRHAEHGGGIGFAYQVGRQGCGAGIAGQVGGGETHPERGMGLALFAYQPTAASTYWRT